MYGAEFRYRLFELIDKDPPAGMVRWDCSSLASEFELGGSSVQFGDSCAKKVFTFIGQGHGVLVQSQSSSAKLQI